MQPGSRGAVLYAEGIFQWQAPQTADGEYHSQSCPTRREEGEEQDTLSF